MTSKSPLELLNSSHQSKVLKAAIFSTFVLFILSILWRTLLAPYDTSASLNPTCLRNPPLPSPLLLSFGSAIENGVIWDNVYFVRIAQCGYEYEQSYAFLPLLPACIFAFSRTVFAPLVPIIGYRAVLAFSGYVVCNVAFIFTAMYFYRLSVIILKDPNVALQASILFCFNPASIFYSSIYSESLYALFSVGGCYYLVSRANKIAAMHKAYDAFYLKKRGFEMDELCDEWVPKSLIPPITQEMLSEPPVLERNHVRLRWRNMVLDLVVLVDSMAQLVVCLVIGDNLKTMKAIALESGILLSDVNTSEPNLIEGKVLSSLSDSQREKSC